MGGRGRESRESKMRKRGNRYGEVCYKLKERRGKGKDR